MLNEKALRDKLAKKLDILETGLTLVAIEHHLRNPLGAKGFVDILARDAFGSIVIIELKRSNAAARQALNELHKYIALFGIEHGLSASKIRCFVVSTVWHELLVPLSEFARSTEHQTTGFQLVVSEEGDLIGASRVDLAIGAKPLKLFREHAIYMFIGAAARDASSEILIGLVIDAGAEAACVVDLDYDGRNPQVIYRYACYVVPGDLPQALHRSLEDRIRTENDYQPDDEIGLDSIEQQFLASLHDDAIERDSYEIGYPEKFASITSTGWDVRRLWRRGRVASELLYLDADLLRALGGLEGENSYIFRRFTSPKLVLAWKDAKQAALRSLTGNGLWLRRFQDFTREVETRSPSASVSMSIYNPLNLPVWMFKLASSGTDQYLPMMELVADIGDGSSVTAIVGFVAWDGTLAPTKIEELLGGEFQDVFEFLSALHFGVAWQSDEILMAAFKIRYVIARYNLHKSVEDGGTVIDDVHIEPEGEIHSLGEYLLKNEAAVRVLMSELRSCSSGL